MITAQLIVPRCAAESLEQNVARAGRQYHDSLGILAPDQAALPTEPPMPGEARSSSSRFSGNNFGY